MKITIEDHCGRLRLRWQYEGKRYTMAVGVNNDATGNAVARKKSSEIELDMQAGYFDPTLLKYKPKILGKTATEITAPELFTKFTQNQAKEKN
jgi:integrase